MSADHIIARNRSNARNSSGPKTAAGKAIVAGNAKKHGVTGRPDPARVRTWLAIILDRPDIGLDDLLPGDDHGILALTLAEAEVRLAAVEDAFVALDKERRVVAKTMFALYNEVEDILQRANEMIIFAQASRRGFKTSIRIVNDKFGARTTGLPLREQRRKILTRYLAEAKSRRRRAFAAWIAMEADEKAYQQVLSPNKASGQAQPQRGQR